MIIKGYLLTIALLIAGIQVFGQFRVNRITTGTLSAGKEGIIYNLPRTGIKVDISVKKTQKVKGPFSEFAEKYLGLNQVVNVNSTEYEITSIQMSSFSEPDPNEMYFIELPGRQKDRDALGIYLSELGTLTGIETKGPLGPERRDKQYTSSKDLKIPEMPNPGMFEQIDTVIRKISVDTVTIEQKVLRKISSAKTLDQKAKEAADFILKLDESMFNLINGYQEVNYEKGTMEFMYQQMAELKDDYLQLFKGVIGNAIENYSFTFYPSNTDENSSVTLCRFSLSKGILDKSALTGDQIQLELKNQNLLREIRNFAESRSSDSDLTKGVYYRIPDEAQVAVKVGGLVRVEARFPVNQYGITTFLPPTSFENIQLHNNTGTLKHVIAK